MLEEDRNKMRIDEIFALYLYRISNRTNQDYFKNTVLPFVILFRESLSEIGWGKRIELEKIDVDTNLELKKMVEN